MKHRHLPGISLRAVSFILFAFSFLSPQHLFAQRVAINGYGQASYTAEKAGKFMQQWLVAGPFAVSKDSTGPGEALQEKVFKESKIQTRFCRNSITRHMKIIVSFFS